MKFGNVLSHFFPLPTRVPTWSRPQAFPSWATTRPAPALDCAGTPL